MLLTSFYRYRILRAEQRIDEIERQLEYVIKKTGVNMLEYQSSKAVYLMCKGDELDAAKELMQKYQKKDANSESNQAQ
ncbi:MAG: hypothetical protein MJH11_16230 [Lentisphaeria bacterium]|nr:hypothetical protein [Lentisphaeria bacterium]